MVVLVATVISFVASIIPIALQDYSLYLRMWEHLPLMLLGYKALRLFHLGQLGQKYVILFKRGSRGDPKFSSKSPPFPKRIAAVGVLAAFLEDQ